MTGVTHCAQLVTEGFQAFAHGAPRLLEVKKMVLQRRVKMVAHTVAVTS